MSKALFPQLQCVLVSQCRCLSSYLSPWICFTWSLSSNPIHRFLQGNLHDRYGHIVALSAKFLCLKMEFHKKVNFF